MAYDVMAGMQDILGYQGLVGQNPYLTYQGAIPFGNNFQTINPFTGQVQNPTDAMGIPIGAPSAPPGVTLNSSPAAAAPAAAPASSSGATGGGILDTPALQQYMANYNAAQAAKSPQQLASEAQSAAYRNQQLQSMQIASDIKAAQGGFGNMPGGAFNPNPGYMPPMQAQAPAPAPAAQPAASLAPSGPQPLSNAQYLSLLANPGPLKPVGAAPPGPGQAPTGSSSGQGNVLSAFLAANKSGNTPFLNTLRTMQNQAAGGVS